MKVVIYMRGQVAQLRAVATGLARHGIVAQYADPARDPPRCDVAITWGAKRSRRAAAARARRWLVVERGFVGDRHLWTSVGWNGLNGRADFRAAGRPADRWERYHAHLMRPWRTEFSYDSGLSPIVGVMGQVPGDAALIGVDVDRWYQQTVDRLRSAGCVTLFRPHPERAPHRLPSGCEIVPKERLGLDEFLDRCDWIVTFNSNSAVVAVLRGTPTVAVDEGSMAWAVTGRDPCAPPPTPDRERWAAELAWCQWLPTELERGDFWEHLRDDTDT